MSEPLTDEEFEEAVMSKVDIDEHGCWLWNVAQSSAGYGRFSYKGKMFSAHRVSYELHKGPIPDGLQIDHLCRVKRCINPEHLEAVTPKENTNRGDGNFKKTHCPQGHAYTDENTHKDKNGKRYCKACGSEKAKTKYWKVQAERLKEEVDSLKEHKQEMLECWVNEVLVLKEENAKLRAEGMYWKHTAAAWLPGKYGRGLKIEGWGKNYAGLNDLNELRLK